MSSWLLFRLVASTIPPIGGGAEKLGLRRLLGRKIGGEDEEAGRHIESFERQETGAPEVGGESRALGGYFLEGLLAQTPQSSS